MDAFVVVVDATPVANPHGERVVEMLERDGQRLIRVAVATANEAGEVKVFGDALAALP